jgi:hypothetical protein
METTFFTELMAKSMEPKVLKTSVRVVSDATTLEEPDPLMVILGLEEIVMSEEALRTLDAFEKGRDDTTQTAAWNDFKWKLTAFVEIQDIFDARLMKGLHLNAFHLWYFYFESKRLLEEAVICGFNGLYAASNALLRLFLEFNILQNYYYRAVTGGNSYEPLEKYFSTQIPPRWNTLLKGALPNESFAKPIRFRLQLHLKGLSELFSHSYHPDHSPRRHADTVSMPSLEGIFFWARLRILLDAVLWTYYTNFPMLFHPRDTLKKFGFNPPVGVFVDDYTGATVRKSLRKEEYEAFLTLSASEDIVASLTEWYESLPTLTEEQVISTWNKEEHGELKSLLAGYAIQKARLRGLRELMALRPAVAAPNEQEESDYEVIFSYSFWEKVSKRRKKH